MNHFKNLKQSKKILIVFLLIVCISCIIAPFVKVALDSLLSSSPFMVRLLDYEHGSYDFGKVMRRIMLTVAILIIFLLRKPLLLKSVTTLGIKNTQWWWRQFQIGFILGIGMLTMYTSFLYANGTKIFEIEVKSFSDLMAQLLKIFFVAVLIGCIEEIFFRGFILQSLLKDMQAVFAVFISSTFYSSLHFLKIESHSSPGIQPFIGFMVIYRFFENLILNFTTILPSLVGLFLVGVVLSYACLRTNSLYLAIGLHAGWVFLIKVNHLFFDNVKSSLRWLYGDSNMVTGVLGWILLIVTLFLIRFVTKVPFEWKKRYKNSPSTLEA